MGHSFGRWEVGGVRTGRACKLIPAAPVPAADDNTARDGLQPFDVLLELRSDDDKAFYKRRTVVAAVLDDETPEGGCGLRTRQSGRVLRTYVLPHSCWSSHQEAVPFYYCPAGKHIVQTC